MATARARGCRAPPKISEGLQPVGGRRGSAGARESERLEPGLVGGGREAEEVGSAGRAADAPAGLVQHGQEVRARSAPGQGGGRARDPARPLPSSPGHCPAWVAPLPVNFSGIVSNVALQAGQQKWYIVPLYAEVAPAFFSSTCIPHTGSFTMLVPVETFKDVVQLSGFVNSAEIRSRAGVVASRVSGVKSVKNNLIVK